ncbi:MAG: hypothetical protein ACKO3W_15680 [bacterium]
MTEERRRQDRIARLIDLARNYRGWSAGRLDEALGRESRRAVPLSGNPKLDLVARLAAALEWDLGEVAEDLWDGDFAAEDACSDRDDGGRRGATFVELDLRAQAEHRAGDAEGMRRTATAMRAVARSGHERAVAANRLAGAFDGRGRFARVLACVREGLAEQGVGADVRLMLRVNLANANHALWNLDESRAIASSLLEERAVREPANRLQRVAGAFCHLVRGHGHRRTLQDATRPGGIVDRSVASELARRAIDDLSRAVERYEELAQAFGDGQYVGLADAARGGIVEARVACGELSEEEAIATVIARLERSVEAEEAGVCEAPAVREAAGWWALFGANIALGSRGPHDPDGDSAAQTLAICTNKASEVADELDHWPMRERTFSLEWIRREQEARRERTRPAGWTLDEEDLRGIVGSMGRFPFFRPIGWKILDGAEILAPA